MDGTIIETGTESYRLAQTEARQQRGYRKSPGGRGGSWQAGGMASLGDQELSTAIQNADSSTWSVRATAGRQLAMSDKVDEAADVIHRLLLDVQNTAVTQETAVALLQRKDTIGLRCVLLARSYASETWTADEIQAALDCNPEWMTTEGADRLIKQYRELATDRDAGIRDEAQRLLAQLRPREGLRSGHLTLDRSELLAVGWGRARPEAEAGSSRKDPLHDGMEPPGTGKVGPSSDR